MTHWRDDGEAGQVIASGTTSLQASAAAAVKLVPSHVMYVRETSVNLHFIGIILLASV